MAGGLEMADPNYGLIGDDASDDLPRTLRRERESREREAREREAKERAQNPALNMPAGDGARAHRASLPLDAAADPYAGYDDAAAGFPDMPFPASVRRFDVPFWHLVAFFLKAVIAAIPALILLTAILWTGGYVAKMYFPELLQMKVLISFPGS